MAPTRRPGPAVVQVLLALVILWLPGCDLRAPSDEPRAQRRVPSETATPHARSDETDPTLARLDEPISVFFSVGAVAASRAERTGGSAPTVEEPSSIGDVAAGFIGRAVRTLDCAFFEIDSRAVTAALIDAHRRGVRVRIVSDADYRDNAEARAIEAAGVPIVWDTRSALMHDKFMVADGEAVWTGSWNATENCTFRNDNNAVAFRSAELAKNFTAEFEEMFLERRFGPRSPSRTPHSKTSVAGADVYTWFSPEDDVREKVLRFVRAARRSVHVLAFSFSDDELASLLVDKHGAGLDVGVVVERRGSTARGAELERLRSAGVAAATDGNRYLMHHKVIIVDGLWTITGSYNFSRAAAESNDENIVVIKSPVVAERFEAEYRRIRGGKDEGT